MTLFDLLEVIPEVPLYFYPVLPMVRINLCMSGYARKMHVSKMSLLQLFGYILLYSKVPEAVSSPGHVGVWGEHLQTE